MERVSGDGGAAGGRRVGALVFLSLTLPALAASLSAPSDRAARRPASSRLPSSVVMREVSASQSMSAAAAAAGGAASAANARRAARACCFFVCVREREWGKARVSGRVRWLSTPYPACGTEGEKGGGGQRRRGRAAAGRAVAARKKQSAPSRKKTKRADGRISPPALPPAQAGTRPTGSPAQTQGPVAAVRVAKNRPSLFRGLCHDRRRERAHANHTRHPPLTATAPCERTGRPRAAWCLSCV